MKCIAIVILIIIAINGYGVVYSTQPYNTDTFIQSFYPTDTDATTEIIMIGVENAGGNLNVCRELLRFNVSEIPSGSLCVGATLYMLMTYADNPTLDRQASVYAIRSDRSDWVNTQATWSVYKTGSNWGTAGCSNTTNDYDPIAIATFTTPTTYPTTIAIPLNKTVISGWFGATNTNYGIMIRQDVESNNFRKKEFASSRYTVAVSSRPRVEVEYTTPLPSSFLIPIIRMGD